MGGACGGSGAWIGLGLVANGADVEVGAPGITSPPAPAAASPPAAVPPSAAGVPERGAPLQQVERQRAYHRRPARHLARQIALVNGRVRRHLGGEVVIAHPLGASKQRRGRRIGGRRTACLWHIGVGRGEGRRRMQ
eukprot:scaffold472_cov109-Isochrysis_galbana.AAC.8